MPYEALDVDADGAKWLPWAQSLLYKLKVVLVASGVDSGRRNYITPDGNGRIILRTSHIEDGDELDPNAWMDYIKISGCLERQGFILFKDNGFTTAKYQAYYVDGVIERIHPWDGTPSPDPEPSVTTRAKNYKVPVDLQNDDFLSRNTASRYSGIMRKVVGCYHVQGRNAPFSYTWGKTHGIAKFTTQVGDPVDKHWIVEISSGGVFAAPITNTGDCCGSWDASRYMPTSDEVADQPGLGQYRTTLSLAWAFYGRPNSGVVEMIPDADMEMYVRSPFYAGHGWAFNYSGTEAQAVTQEFFLTPAKHHECSRFKISFSYDQGGDRLSAEMETVEANQPASFSMGRVWVPTEAATWEGQRMGDATSFTTYPAQSAPIHVYYDGDDEVVTRFTLSHQADTEVVTSEPPYGNTTAGSFNTFPWSSQPSEVIDINGTPTQLYEEEQSGPTFKYTTNTGQIAGFSSPGFSYISDSRTYSNIDDSMSETDGISSTLVQNFGGTCRTHWEILSQDGVLTLTRVETIGNTSGHTGLVLFAGEREAVLAVHDEARNDNVITSFYTAGVRRYDQTTTLELHTCTPTGVWRTTNVSPELGVVNVPSPRGTVTSDIMVTPYTAVATLLTGPAADTANVTGRDLSDFLQASPLISFLTVNSAAYAMHGNLRDPDLDLTPPDQSENRAVRLDSPLVFSGGFAQPDDNPYGAVAFVGKA